MNISDENIKKMPENIFKSLVNQNTCKTGLKYLKTKQSKGEELQDYLNPCSNITLEEQRYIFSLRSRMNELRPNFSRNRTLKSEYCEKVVERN